MHKALPAIVALSVVSCGSRLPGPVRGYPQALRDFSKVDVSRCAPLLDDPQSDPIAHVWVTFSAAGGVESVQMDRGADLMSTSAARCVTETLRAMPVIPDPRLPHTLGRSLRLRPHPPKEGVTAGLDRAAVAAALGNVDFQTCRVDDGPTGSGHVQVRFAPDGTVIDAVVDQPPFAGTRMSECTEYDLMAIRIPPFEGIPVTVGKSFTIE